MSRGLPPWAKPHPKYKDAVLVDPDLMYPAYLKEFGISEDEVTVTWLEIAYQCMKLDLQKALRTTHLKIHVRADDGRRLRWNFSVHKGKKEDADFVTKSGKAKAFYDQLQLSRRLRR